MKRIFRYAFFGCFCLIVVLFMLLPGNAESFTDEYERLPQSEMQAFLERRGFRVAEDRPRDIRIDCFAARNGRFYAIGREEGLFSNYCSISVYNGRDEHLFSAFFDYDAGLDLAWDNDNLLIQFVRSDKILEITPDGQCKALYDVSNLETGYPLSGFNGHIDMIGFPKYFEQEKILYKATSTTIERTYPDGTSAVIYKAPAIYKWLPIIWIKLFIVVFVAGLMTKVNEWDRKQSLRFLQR